MRSKILFQQIILCFLFLCSVQASAQQSHINLSNSVFKDARVIFDKNGEGVKFIRFTQGNGVPIESFFKEYSNAFNWSDDNEARLFRVTKDDIGQSHQRYKQYYKGVELAEVEFILHEKNGIIISANGNLIHGLNINVVPTISEQVALQCALANINAESYMWENEKNESHFRKEQGDPTATMRPKGNILISSKDFKFGKEGFRLVYRFDIYTEKPLDRYYIDVDAHSGEIINKISRMQSGDVPGQGTSFYNGGVQMTIADTAITIIPPSRWHPDSWNAYQNGLSWWCADPSYGNQGGYGNIWYEGMDTDPIFLSGSNLTLKFYHRYKVEDPAGASSPYNGWDGMNVRISTDGGTTWQILQNPNPAYSNTSLYSFGASHGEGPDIPGWSGELSTWTNVSFNLSAFTGQTIIVRFAFASDGSVSTNDGRPDLFGWQIDNIIISNSTDTLFSNYGTLSGLTSINLVNEVSFIEGNYRLRQYGRGGGISTYNMGNTGFTTLSTDFVDDDTNFDTDNARVGVSVHWGLESTYDYYLNTFNRNSFDDNAGKYIAYAHCGNGWDNAMWDGSRMLFGDGPLNSVPLVSIDVVAHELTHGVTQYSASLIYLNEFGALNESFSDIFGTAVEFYALGSGANWLIFDFRSMSDPKQFSQPDTYHGQFWYYGAMDNGGVHTNSGVQNYWYYLLTEGGSGVNDYGHSYSVTGIGMDASSKISYGNLTNYLIPTSEYFDARFGSMNAAIDLFGLSSTEFQSVIDAWNAVGVMKPNFVQTVGIERDTISFSAEVQFSPDTVDISVSNYGLETLNITSIEIAGANFQNLSTFSFPIVLNYDESITIKVVFTPTQQGQVFGTLTIGSNDPATPNKTVILKGEGFIVHPAQDGYIYAVTNENNSTFITLNPNSGSGTLLGQTGVQKIYSMAIRPSNGQIFATQVNAASTPLIRIDSETGKTYLFTDLPLGYIKAIAFDNNDNLYGAAYNGNLYSINLLNGNLTLIGATGVTGISSLAINPVDGQMWATPLGGAIYKIDKSNGSATLVGNTGFSQTPSIAFDLEGKFFGSIKFSSAANSELISIDKLTAIGTVIGTTGFPLVSGLVIKGIVIVGVEEELFEIPTEFSISQNYPNPFNPSTTFTYSIPHSSQVVIKVFDVLGNEIETLVNEEKPAGTYELAWSAVNLTSGVYFYQLKAGDFIETKKMILLK